MNQKAKTMSQNVPLLEIYKEEFSKLKDEQIGRIGFRDNLIYVTLVVIGSIFAFVLSGKGASEVLLVLPWVSFVLGWTYISNDQKISAIGKYLKTEWKQKVNKILGTLEVENDLMGWESFHKIDGSRLRRKTFQLSVDCLVFIAPGVLSMGYLMLLEFNNGTLDTGKVAVIFFEIILLVILIIELYRHVDFSVDQ